MPTPYRVAAVQMDVAFADREKNLQRMSDFLAETTKQFTSLTVFPECALTGYCFESLDEALPVSETIPGPSTDHFSKLCLQYDTHVVYGLLERDGDRLFNACALVGPGGVIGSYRKIHLPYLGIDRFVTPGDRPFAVHQAGAARVGMNICYDGVFPESSRVMALDGADLVVLPTNWPPGAECTADFIVGMRALENCVYQMAVDRVGTERGFSFIGKSRICLTNGETAAYAPHTDEAILYAELDLDRARDKHIVRVPHKHEINRFADRRPEMYARILDPVQHKRPPLK